MASKVIGVIGYGTMGRAIAEQLAPFFTIVVHDSDEARTLNVYPGVQRAVTASELVEAADIIVIAVKPQDIQTVTEEVAALAKDKLVVSIMAGVTTARLEGILPGARIVRTMPNMPLKIGRGMTCIASGKIATRNDVVTVEKMFARMGDTMIMSENRINASTAVSGSGPGFFYYLVRDKSLVEAQIFVRGEFIPQLAQAGQAVGFTAEESAFLARATGEGALAFLEITGVSARRAEEMVASKGGTTEAGINALQEGKTLGDAVMVALNRAEELSK